MFERDPEQQVRDEAAFAMMLREHIRRWKPEDARDAREFEFQVYTLIQRAQAIAQAPLVAQMSAAMSLAPLIMPTTIAKKDT